MKIFLENRGKIANTTEKIDFKPKGTMSTATQTASKLSQLHFVIATIFEGVKYLHQVALYTLLPATEYGLVGSVFSLAYLSANIACLDGGTSLIPHITTISIHKRRFSFLVKNLFLPQCIQHCIAATITSYLVHQLTDQTIVSAASGIIAFSEGMRIALRPLIYTITKSPLIAKNEALIAFSYIGGLWLAATIGSLSMMQAPTIITLYAITSIIGLTYLAYQGYLALTQIAPISTAKLPSTKKLIATQVSLLALHLPHNLFSANFIVPFFAYRNGMASAGAIKITSEIASAIKAIIKSSIGFPLNTLFGQLQQKLASKGEERRKIFDSIQEVTTRATTILLTTLSIIGVVFIIPWNLPTKIVLGGFCLLTVADYLCMPYELLCIHSNTVGRAALIRGAEVIVDIGIMTLCAQWPLCVICGIGIVRLVTWKFLSQATRPALFFVGPSQD